jgi:hypothetical protein
MSGLLRAHLTPFDDGDFLMPKFSANLSMLFPENDFLERFPAAARAGFAGVEYVVPYAYPKEQVAELLQKNNLKQVLFNLPAGNWEAGERGLGCLRPGGRVSGQRARPRLCQGAGAPRSTAWRAFCRVMLAAHRLRHLLQSCLCGEGVQKKSCPCRDILP